MTLTSFSFFVFFAACILCYYILPQKIRWTGLLGFSILFFVFSCPPITGIFLLGCILVTHTCCMQIHRFKKTDPGKAKGFLICGIIIDLSMLAVLKYSNFFALHWNAIAARTHLNASVRIPDWPVPLGISFYTLQAVGMMADTWREITEPEHNIFKSALFIAYYPQLTSGPIARYEELKESLFRGNAFSWTNFTHGLQLMLWGLFKKLVLSARLALVVDGIYGDMEMYNGFYIWIAAGLFMLQLYTDFSGYMDIIIGASEVFGIKLPENFRTPFFSRSVREFWQRWHITFGAFMRDYVFYPIQHAYYFIHIRKALSQKIGRKAADRITTGAALLCIWFLTGLWHGGAYKYIFGWGLWFWLCLILGQTGEPLWKKLRIFFKVRESSFSWRLFQILRTFILVSVGNIFFRAGSLKAAFRTISLGFTSADNPWILFDGSYSRFGLSQKEVFLTFAGLLILLLVSVLQQSGSVREKIDRQGIVFRWVLYFMLLFAVIVFGKYSPDYNPADFIYRGF